MADRGLLGRSRVAVVVPRCRACARSACSRPRRSRTDRTARHCQLSAFATLSTKQRRERAAVPRRRHREGPLLPVPRRHGQHLRRQIAVRESGASKESSHPVATGRLTCSDCTFPTWVRRRESPFVAQVHRASPPVTPYVAVPRGWQHASERERARLLRGTSHDTSMRIRPRAP